MLELIGSILLSGAIAFVLLSVVIFGVFGLKQLVEYLIHRYKR